MDYFHRTAIFEIQITISMKQTAHFGLIPAIVLTILSGCSGNSSRNASPAISPDRDIEASVDRTLKGMSIEEKAGQMVQLAIDAIYNSVTGEFNEDAMKTIFDEYKIGSILNVPGIAPSKARMAEILKVIQDRSMSTIGIPCIYGLDMIHGTSYYSDGTFFPQEINLAATMNTEYAKAMGKVIGYETRAGMVPWVFSPVMDLTRNACWPRNWESYGEDPYIQARMASEETRAIQGDDPNHIDSFHSAVSIKHFMGYGNPASGKDRTPAYIADNDLREKYFAPFQACVEAGALSLMVNSASINGVPTHANYKLLTEWLKEGLNWDGMIVTDWADLNNLFERDHIAADKKDAIRMGINAGIDMIMEPYDPKAAGIIVELANEGKIPMDRIDDAVRRILRLKYRLGLFDEPVWSSGYPEYGCAEFIAASRNAAIESEVLLKNDGILPLKEGTRILVTGPNGNSIRTLNGGWSYTWQGSELPGVTDKYNTIYEAVAQRFGEGNVRYAEGVRYDPSSWTNECSDGIGDAVAAARNCDVILACIGENSYCETPGNIDDLTISSKQIALVKALAGTGKPIILVLNEGRARIVRDIEPLASAVIDIMLPGNYGGDALAALVSGDENFSGKLPFTYPKYTNSIHTYDYKVSEHREVMEGAYNYDAVMDVQWPFASGLSYTSFEYSNLTVDNTEFKSGDSLLVSVDVTNTGDRPGKESVIIYSSDLVASIIPDVRRVRAFAKTELKPGETGTLEFVIPANDLAFVGQDGRWRLEAGAFRISAGGLGVMVSCTEDKVWDTRNTQQ